jgi:Fe-S cluster assembly ATPase SufC
VQEVVYHTCLKDLYHEAHIQCIITHYANVLGEVIKKDQVRLMLL